MAKKKKKAKEAMKTLLGSGFVIEKLKAIFGMQEYDDEDVKKVFKKCIKFFLENNDVDEDQNMWRKSFNNKNDDDDDIFGDEVEIVPEDKKKVRKVSKNKKIIAQFDDLLGK